MNLRSKILLILAGVVAVYAAGAWFIQRAVVFPSFQELERVQAQQDLERVLEALGRETEHLDLFCYDWAAWDDTYQFVGDRNEDYIAANLGVSTFENGNFDLVWFLNLEGKAVWGECRDPHDADTPLELSRFPRELWPLDDPLLRSRVESESVHGLELTEHWPMLLSARPIVNSFKDQPMRGWLVMGLFLDRERFAALAEQTRVDFRTWSTEETLPGLEHQALAALRSEKPRLSVARDEHLLQTYALLSDIEGKQGLLVRADVPRKVTAEGRDALHFASMNTMAAALVLLLVLMVILQRTVVDPLIRLTRHAVGIGRSDDLTSKLALQRDDEIGVLSREFDRMVERLAESQSELLDAARLGGMSEIATGVLHDVGNVLNSVNVSASLAASKVESQSLADLERVSEILAEHAQELDTWLASDPKGKRLPGFLLALSRGLVQERSELKEELRSLASGVGHIKALVDAQQPFAGNSGVLERVSVSDLIETALKISLTPSVQAGGADGEVRVVRSFEELPPVFVHKHRVLQILVNLVRNARQALVAGGRTEKTIAVHLARAGAGIRIEISDDGCGIAPENLERIFQHGFTTKQDGHGFGLHASANVAREIGGRLTAESEGLGRGARFTLELPLRETQPA